MGTNTLLSIAVLMGAGSVSFADAQEVQTASSVRTAAAMLAPQPAPELLTRPARLDALTPAMPLASSSLASSSSDARSDARISESAREEAPIQGIITGRVVSARTQQPLPSAQVSLVGTGLGGLTNSSGRYLLLDMPDGVHTLRAVLIGYAAAEQQVTITSGTTITADFQLEVEALALDAIVVTGTAGQARRREVGNSITQLNPADLVGTATSVEQLLQGRGLGMTVLTSTATEGAGAQIRLRGNVSVSMSNQPLMYIDGIRVQNEGYRRYASTGDNRSPLADLNPNDIERVEIIKGAAATTLYGSDASAGVVQIFTKRGISGEPAWNAEISQGFSEVRPFGAGDNPFLFLGPWLKKGWRQRYSASVRGGSDDMRYYVSGLWEDNEGPTPNNFQEMLSLRANFGFDLAEGLTFEVNSSLAHANLEGLSQGGSPTFSFVLNAIRGEQGYVGTRDFETLSLMLDQKNPQTTDRLITGATLTYAPTDNLSNRLVLGHDLSLADQQRLRPFGWQNLDDLGSIRSGRWSQRNLTSDYSGSYSGLPAFSGISTLLSWGAQYISRETELLRADGNDLPGPGEFTVSAGGRPSATESRTRIITAGLFGQTMFSFEDRLFLTLGARLDGNSAFGAALGLEVYPKASMSYVISDEDYWPDEFGDVKLRLAYGHAGRAPGAFDAVRTWSTPDYGGRPAISPNNLGNPELAPERTEEIEAGFDAGFFGNRLAVDFTYYRQITSDALLPVTQPPSGGNWSAQIENVGKMRNTGIEVAVNATLVEGADWAVRAGARLSTNHSKMLDMGTTPSFVLPISGRPPADAWVIEGEPVPVMQAWKILNRDEIADPIFDEEFRFGPNHPTRIISGDLEVQFPAGIVASVTGEFQGGHYVQNLATARALTRSVNPWPFCVEAYAKAPDQRLAWERGECFGAPTFNMFTMPADFFRLRDISVRFPLTSVFPGVNDASLSFSARNFWGRWNNKDWTVFDPEQAGSQGIGAAFRWLDETIPPPGVITVSLRASW